jgi:hypothetical protein
MSVNLTKDPSVTLLQTTARAAIKNTPAHTFQTGAEGRSVSKKITVTDEHGKKRKAVVSVTVVFSDTTQKAKERAAKAATAE